MGQCVPIPTMGMVYAGTGAVCENPTCGLPVIDPNWSLHTGLITELSSQWHLIFIVKQVWLNILYIQPSGFFKSNGLDIPRRFAKNSDRIFNKVDNPNG